MDSSMADGIATRQVPESSVILSAAWTDLQPLQATPRLPAMPGEPSKDALSPFLISIVRKQAAGRQEVVSTTFLPFHFCSMSEGHGRGYWSPSSWVWFLALPDVGQPALLCLYPDACVSKALLLGHGWGLGRITFLCLFLCFLLYFSVLTSIVSLQRKGTSFNPAPSLIHSTYFYYLRGFRWRRHAVIKDYRNELKMCTKRSIRCGWIVEGSSRVREDSEGM